jgi:hypothetical protein
MSNIAGLQRYIAMFFHGISVTFIFQKLQSLDDSEAGPGRLNDVVNIAALCSNKRINYLGSSVFFASLA